LAFYVWRLLYTLARHINSLRKIWFCITFEERSFRRRLFYLRAWESVIAISLRRKVRQSPIRRIDREEQWLSSFVLGQRVRVATLCRWAIGTFERCLPIMWKSCTFQLYPLTFASCYSSRSKLNQYSAFGNGERLQKVRFRKIIFWNKIISNCYTVKILI